MTMDRPPHETAQDWLQLLLTVAALVAITLVGPTPVFAAQGLPTGVVPGRDGWWELVRNDLLYDDFNSNPNALVAGGEEVSFFSNGDGDQFMVAGQTWKYRAVADGRYELTRNGRTLMLSVTASPDEYRLEDDDEHVVVIARFAIRPADPASLAGTYRIAGVSWELYQPFGNGQWTLQLGSDGTVTLQDSGINHGNYGGTYTVDGDILTATMTGTENSTSIREPGPPGSGIRGQVTTRTVTRNKTLQLKVAVSDGAIRLTSPDDTRPVRAWDRFPRAAAPSV
jgi:hypothetical protein